MSESTETKAGVPKKYTTVGTIKTIDLSKYTFTLEPIARYRFQVKDDDENSWMIILKEDVEEASMLRLVKRDEKFEFDRTLISGLITLKENKTRISVKVGSLDAPKGGDDSENKASPPVEIEIL